MNFLRRRLKQPENQVLANYTGTNKLGLQKALVHLLDRTITYQPQENGRNIAKPYQITLREDLNRQVAGEDPLRREARQNPRAKYGHINNSLEINGLLTRGFFEQLVVEVAEEVGIPIDEAIPVVWESLINEIKSDTDFAEGELLAQALEKQMRNSYAFDERYRRAWDAAIATGDLNEMAEIMGKSFMKTNFSKANLDEGAQQETNGFLPEGTPR